MIIFFQYILLNNFASFADFFYFIHDVLFLILDFLFLHTLILSSAHSKSGLALRELLLIFLINII